MRLLLLACLAITAAELPAQTSGPTTRAAETITAADVARHIGVIADDSMMGRGSPSRGLEMTAQYVADQFKKFGLKPGGGNASWVQRFLAPDSVGTAPNTIGIIKGSDPKLKNEYVVICAHMDHIGISHGQPDSINNGADDNASGTAGLLELAEAYSQPGMRPRRSLMFVAFGAEEWSYQEGSRYFIEHPPVPIQQMVANINLDMIGRKWVDSIIVSGTHESDLGGTLDRVVAAHPELRMSPIAKGSAFSFESDQYYFAKHGVPVLYFKNGDHEDYHQVTDSPEKINAEKEARVVRLAFFVGWEVANAKQRPQWTEEGLREAERRKLKQP